MENYKLILPEHLNHYGFLFGGNLLQWVDEYAWIAVSLDYPRLSFVTIGFDKVEFKKSVNHGTILKFNIEKEKVGKTSVTYNVLVYNAKCNGNKCEQVFSTKVTFVAVDKNGRKKNIS